MSSGFDSKLVHEVRNELQEAEGRSNNHIKAVRENKLKGNKRLDSLQNVRQL